MLSGKKSCPRLCRNDDATRDTRKLHISNAASSVPPTPPRQHNPFNIIINTIMTSAAPLATPPLFSDLSKAARDVLWCAPNGEGAFAATAGAAIKVQSTTADGVVINASTRLDASGHASPQLMLAATPRKPLLLVGIVDSTASNLTGVLVLHLGLLSVVVRGLLPCLLNWRGSMAAHSGVEAMHARHPELNCPRASLLLLLLPWMQARPHSAEFWAIPG